MSSTKKFVFVGMMVMALLMPVLVLAALPNPAPPGGIGGSAITLAEIETRITEIARFLIIVGVIVAVIFIVWGGLAYMFAGGGDAATAKTRIWNGVIGAAVILGVGVILQTLAGLIARSFFNV